MIDCESGALVNEIAGAGAVTFNVTTIGAIVMPLAVALTLIEKVPTGVAVDVVTVIVELVAVVVLGEKVAVAPAGKPVAESVTLSVKPSLRSLIV
jgi:hypothetical protein